MTAMMQALCCICGALRTCRRPRNHRTENVWLRGPVDLDWHRETGDLKCAECGRVTTHALLLPNNLMRDHAEAIHREAIGYFSKWLSPEVREGLQQKWRQGLPRNPYLHHIWWVGDETRAREAGDTHLSAICMERVPLPKAKITKAGDGVDRDQFMKPSRFHDVDREDPSNGPVVVLDVVSRLLAAVERHRARRAAKGAAKQSHRGGHADQLDGRPDRASRPVPVVQVEQSGAVRAMISTNEMEARPDRGAGAPPSSGQRAWFACHEFIAAVIEQAALGPLPAAGTPSWMQLADGDPRKLLALAEAGVHHVLRVDTHQAEMAESSREIARSVDCSALARRIRNRHSSAYIPRRTA